MLPHRSDVESAAARLPASDRVPVARQARTPRRPSTTAMARLTTMSTLCATQYPVGRSSPRW